MRISLMASLVAVAALAMPLHATATEPFTATCDDLVVTSYYYYHIRHEVRGEAVGPAACDGDAQAGTVLPAADGFRVVLDVPVEGHPHDLYVEILGFGWDASFRMYWGAFDLTSYSTDVIPINALDAGAMTLRLALPDGTILTGTYVKSV